MKKLLLIALLAVGCDQTEEFIKNIPNATSVVCADQDTDGDGYVTCTVFRGSDDCYNCARGCKNEPYRSMGKKR